eukprot:3941956-Rhodomonas_salina.6
MLSGTDVDHRTALCDARYCNRLPCDWRYAASGAVLSSATVLPGRLHRRTTGVHFAHPSYWRLSGDPNLGTAGRIAGA